MKYTTGTEIGSRLRPVKIMRAIKDYYQQPQITKAFEAAPSITVYLFTALIPMMLLLAASYKDFESTSGFGVLLARRLQLSAEQTKLVTTTFGASAPLRSYWSFIGLVGFLFWLLPLGRLVAKLFIQTWSVSSGRVGSLLVRGNVWLLGFMLMMVANLFLRDQEAQGVDAFIRFLASLLPPLIFWALTPALLLGVKYVNKRDALVCALFGLALDTLVLRPTTHFIVPTLLTSWNGFGPIGVAMVLMTWCSVVAMTWVLIAVIGSGLHRAKYT